jgi:hypothetical protein
MGNTRNTGYLQNIVVYDANDNITLPARLAVTGTVSVNNTTPYDTTQFSLDVNGGLIVKNINKTAQFVLINSNPASGGNNAFVVHTVGGTSASSYADIQGYYGTSIAGSTVLRLNPQGGNVLVGSLAGTGSRMVIASSTGVLSTQAIVTLGDLSGVSTARTITINGTTQDLSANRTWTLYTDDISEDGSPVNLWFTNARARAAISVTGSGSYDSATGIITVTGGVTAVNTKTGDVTLTSSDITEGTRLYYTDARARAAISVTGSGSYNSTTGVITVTGGVTSVNTLTGAVTLTTTNIAEGTNLYYTDARVLAYLGANSYATQSYVGTQINNLVAGAPGLLDTLDELAAALGDDANFATTTATSLGNRLRIDTAAQGLNSTQQGNGRTNLGLGSLATLSSIGNSYITDLAWSKLSSTPTTISGYGITNAYTDAQIQNFFNGANAISGYNKSNWDTAYGWGNHASAGYLTTSSASSTYLTSATAATTYVSLTGSYANPSWITSLAYSKLTGVPAFLTSYTETDTLATITGRGASTSTAVTLSGGATITGLTIAKSAGVSTITFPAGTNDPAFISHIESTANVGIMRFSVGDDNDTIDYFGFGNTNVPDAFRINANGIISTGTWQGTAIADTYISSAATWNAKQAQLNGTGFVKVTGTTVSYDNSTYLTTGTASTTYVPYTGATSDVNIGTNIFKSNYILLEGDASSGGYIGFKQKSGVQGAGLGYSSIAAQGLNKFYFRAYQTGADVKYFNFDLSSITSLTDRTYTLPDASGTLALTSGIPTNNNQLTNGAGYITSYTETDTLSSVVVRGNSTAIGITINPNGTSITMGGGGSAEGIRMQASTSTTYPVFLRSVNPSGGGETSAWLFKEDSTPWGIWHNNPINTYDFTSAGSGGIAQNVGGGTNQVMVRIDPAAGYVQTASGFKNSAGTITLDNSGNISGNAATVSNGVYTTGSYANPAWITSLAYSKITGVPAFITSYTETDTLASVTGRGASTSTDLTFNGTLTMGTGGTQYIRMGRFPASITNTGEAWIGRASDRNAGTMTVQLGGNSASNRQFEVVDYGWSVVLFSVNSNGNITASGTVSGSNLSGTNTGDQTNISGNAATATSATQVVTIQDGPPSGSAGRLWWESDTGKLKVYYGSAWVDASPIPDTSLYYAKAGGPINGDVTVQQTLNVVGNTLVQGTISAFGDVIAYSSSDARLKDNITVIESPLEKVSKINGVSFNWNDKQSAYEVGKKDIGVIAQEVEEVLPELVTTRDNGYKAVRYEKIVALLIEAIKEQQTQINSLTDKLNNL